jgi:hypothetical protein
MFRGRSGRSASWAIATYCIASILAAALIGFATTRWAKAVSDSLAGAESAEFRDPELRYRLTAPKGWHRVSQDVLRVRKLNAGDTPVVEAFEASAEGQLQPPMLLISRIPESDKTPSEINDELSRDPSLHLGEEGRSIVFDDKRGVVMLVEKASTQGGRRIRRLSIFKPATAGIAHLDFYLADGQLPAYTEPLVSSVLNSWVFDDGFATKDRNPAEMASVLLEIKSKLQGNPFLPAMLTFALIGVASSVKLRRRPLSRKTESRRPTA